MSGQNWRITFIVLAIILASAAFRSTLKLWTLPEADKIEMQENQPGEYLALQQRSIRLGLDLQGGLHTILQVELDKLSEAEKEGAVERAIQILRNRIDGLGVVEPVIQKQGDDQIIVDLPGYHDTERAEELIGKTALLEFKLLEGSDNSNLLLRRMDSVIHAYELAQADETADNSAESLTPELDSSDSLADGTDDDTSTNSNSADTADSGDEDILAELLGTDSITDTNDFSFDETFPISADETPLTARILQNWPAYAVSKTDRPKMEKWFALPQVAKLLPVDVEIAWSSKPDLLDQREVYYFYLLKRKVEFIGKYLEGIRLGRDPQGQWVVNFSLSGDGQTRFARLTGANIGKPLAIVLDDKVVSAPILQSKIRKDGQITLGNAVVEEARNLEIVLKAGALPAPVRIIEKYSVGPTLGADSINKGFFSFLVGLAIVFLYIAVYYRASGLIADVGLFFNIFFLLAVLAGAGATLTMPGIAGIILTIGISIDANILIFERIREELRTGKTVRAAIDAGYDRAFIAIIDSHVTTLITALALFIVGKGPIRGFAVTLFWGVLISLFTAYAMTRAIFNVRKKYQSLSI